MAAASKTGTADFDSTYNRMSVFVLTAGADAATVNLREGGAVGGTLKFVVKAALNSTVELQFPQPVAAETGTWFVDLSAGTTPQMTIVSG